MAWTYSDWITQTTPSARLTRIRLHIQEVSDKITASYASDGTSAAAGGLTEYLKGLQREEQALGATSGETRRGSPMFARGVVRGLR